MQRRDVQRRGRGAKGREGYAEKVKGGRSG
jgi:hypothetical protein